METTRKATLTPHQRWALLRLRSTIRRCGRTIPEFSASVLWAHVQDTGSKGAMERLYRKGYAERYVESGPRGGEHFYFTLTVMGSEEADRIVAAGLKVGGR